MAKVKAQIGLDDRIIKDDDLEALLEDREVKKAEAAEYRKADKVAKEKITALNQPMPYRVGRFIIAKAKVQAKRVEFETAESERVTIKTTEA